MKEIDGGGDATASEMEAVEAVEAVMDGVLALHHRLHPPWRDLVLPRSLSLFKCMSQLCLAYVCLSASSFSLFVTISRSLALPPSLPPSLSHLYVCIILCCVCVVALLVLTSTKVLALLVCSRVYVLSLTAHKKKMQILHA